MNDSSHLRPGQRSKIRWLFGALALVLLVLGIKEGRKFVFLDNFGAVEEGVLYRSGQLRPYQIRDVIRDYGVKTVINTREEEAPSELMEAEDQACRAEGAEMVRIMMPGDGRGTYAQYDEALAILSDSNRLPALIHCARGTHRTGALVSAYRVAVEGVPVDDAMREMERYRFKPEGHVLIPHLRPYLEAKRAGQKE